MTTETKARTFLRALARLLEEPGSSERRDRFDAALNDLTAEESGLVALRIDAIEAPELEPRAQFVRNCGEGGMLWRSPSEREAIARHAHKSPRDAFIDATAEC